jgi:Holliday junction DNA helicase RuvA
MIAHLRGRLFSKQPGQAIVEAGGVGYDVTISVPTFIALPSEGSEVSLHIHTQVREDILALFGFMDRNEKRLFERLITVSGVGPKLAVTILSGLNPQRTVAAIRAQDHATLTRIPGVGKKLAERLVVELKEKLVNLGYQRPAALKAIETAVEKDKSAGEDFDALFRAALKVIR